MPVKVALAGVGNCANSLIQGTVFYADAADGEVIPGLMHNRFGPYAVSDIEFVAAFDVDALKVGVDLSDAMWASENGTYRFAEVSHLAVTVQRGPTLDGLGSYYREMIEESDAPAVDVAQVLRDSGADVLVCYLPVGSELAAKHYAQAALDAGVAFVNALPVFIASDPAWAAKFTSAGIPIVGDDIKSQLGATITHRVLARLFEERGLVLDRTYQLNVGGNMDFKNMLERSRLESKKISKTQSVTSNVEAQLNSHDVHIGPSDHVPWLEDRKMAFVRLEGHGFGNAPTSLEYKLEVWDSPNSAGVVIDAGLGGPIEAASAYLMKSPPVQLPDPVARQQLDEWIAALA
jgi:myo-inositol-1-phosphate synthase